MQNAKYDIYIIILDNLSSHKTIKILKLYAENNINIILNSQLISQLNLIELPFWGIKKYLYSNLFSLKDKL